MSKPQTSPNHFTTSHTRVYDGLMLYESIWCYMNVYDGIWWYMMDEYGWWCVCVLDCMCHYVSTLLCWQRFCKDSGSAAPTFSLRASALAIHLDSLEFGLSSFHPRLPSSPSNCAPKSLDNNFWHKHQTFSNILKLLFSSFLILSHHFSSILWFCSPQSISNVFKPTPM